MIHKLNIENQYGSLGFEDGEWRDIGEITYDTRIRFKYKKANKQTNKKKKIQECLITNLYSDNIIVLLGDCNYSEWTCKNEYLCI